MTIGSGFKMRLEFVLEQVFQNLSCGGDHAMRAQVATRLLEAAQSGILKLEDLRRVAQDALLELLQPSNPAEMQHQRIERNSPVSRMSDSDRRSSLV
jgi:hypothetical protein